MTEDIPDLDENFFADPIVTRPGQDLIATVEAERMPKDIKPEYIPQTFEQKLGYLIGEAGEAIAEAGRVVRFGVQGFNPELPVEEQIPNGQLLQNELRDLQRAIDYMRAELRVKGFG